MKKERILLMSALITASAVTTQARINYPDTRRVDTVDTYFGTQVPDPYRWLEDDNSPETEAWVAAQNKVTQNYLSKIPFRKDVKKRITELANYEKMGAPFKIKDKFYFFKNNGRTALNANVNVHYVIPTSNSFALYPLVGFSYGHYTEDVKAGIISGSVSDDRCGANVGLGAQYLIKEHLHFFTEQRFQIMKDFNQSVTVLGLKYTF